MSSRTPARSRIAWKRWDRMLRFHEHPELGVKMQPRSHVAFRPTPCQVTKGETLFYNDRDCDKDRRWGKWCHSP